MISLQHQPVHSYCNLWKSWCQKPSGLRSHPKCSMQTNSHYLYLLWGWWCPVGLINSNMGIHTFCIWLCTDWSIQTPTTLAPNQNGKVEAQRQSSGTGLCHTFYTYVSNISSYESHMNLKWNKLLLFYFQLLVLQSPSWSKYQIYVYLWIYKFDFICIKSND